MAEKYPRLTSQQVMELRRFVMTPEAEKLPLEELQQINDLIEFHKIEVFEHPSANPGDLRGNAVPGNPGATPKQLQIQREFLSGKYRLISVSGANRCLGPDTVVEGHRVSEITGFHAVKSWTGARVIDACADPVFIKGFEPCYRLFLSNGHWLDCSLEHRMLGSDGLFRRVGDALPPSCEQQKSSSSSLQICVYPSGLWTSAGEPHPCKHGSQYQHESQLSLPASTWEPCPSTRTSSAQHLTRTTQGSTADCPACSCSCDAQPLAEAGIASDGAPSRGDAQARTSCSGFERTDDSAGTPARSRPYQSGDRPSSLYDLPLIGGHCGEQQSHASCTPLKLSDEHNQVCSQPTPEFVLPVQPTCESERRANFWFSCGDSNSDGPVTIVAYRPLGVKPIFDFHVPVWNNYLIGNIPQANSGKTVATWNLGACKWLRDFAKNGDTYWAIGPNFNKIIEGPMKWMWECLPRSMFGSRTYSTESGFGVHRRLTLKLPDGRGECALHFKTSDQDPLEYEMVPIHGAMWTECDKEWVFDALLSRLSDYRGWMLVDYVPTEFWQRERLKLSKIPEWKHYCFARRENAHNLPPGEIEYAKSTMTPEEWAVRGEGEDRGSFGIVYQEYREEVHRIEPFRIPDEWPKWRFLDYGGSAPTAVGWGTVAPIGFEIPGRPDLDPNMERMIVYREYYRPGGNIRLHAQNVLSLSVGEMYRGPMLIDPHAFDRSPANPRSIGEQYAAEGLKCKPWPRASRRFGESALVNAVKLALVDRTLLVFDTCEWMNKEFQTWRYKVDGEGRPDPRDVYENRNNHLLDGMRGWVNTRPSFVCVPGSVSVIGS